MPARVGGDRRHPDGQTGGGAGAGHRVGPERLGRLTELGLDHGIDYTTTDFVEQVRQLTDGRGADVIVDSVGGSNLQRSLHCLAYRGGA